jgi:FixJ family two-component response regulator
MNIPGYVFLVDDDYAVRDSLGLVFETAGLAYRTFDSAEQFLQSECTSMPGCLVLDMNMPGLKGHELQAELTRRNIQLPIIFLTAFGDIPMTVRAIKAGAVDFLTKPVPSKLLLERIYAALEQQQKLQEQQSVKQAVSDRLNSLTTRELELLPLVLAGHSNKEIARKLGISHRTIEIHRARIFKKTGAHNLLDLVRLCEGAQPVSEHQ